MNNIFRGNESDIIEYSKPNMFKINDLVDSKTAVEYVETMLVNQEENIKIRRFIKEVIFKINIIEKIKILVSNSYNLLLSNSQKNIIENEYNCLINDYNLIENLDLTESTVKVTINPINPINEKFDYFISNHKKLEEILDYLLNQVLNFSIKRLEDNLKEIYDLCDLIELFLQ